MTDETRLVIEADVMELHRKGLSVSEIASELLLPKGLVHDSIVAEWRRDKAQLAQERADMMNGVEHA